VQTLSGRLPLLAWGRGGMPDTFGVRHRQDIETRHGVWHQLDVAGARHFHRLAGRLHAGVLIYFLMDSFLVSLSKLSAKVLSSLLP
jgi:hypothetical protein